MQKDWPHAPLHCLDEGGVYMVTSGTLHKKYLFRGPERLDLLESALLRLARHYGWQLEVWAMFSNHYHFIGRPDGTATTLRKFLRHPHADTAREVNRLDEQQSRQVWHNYWESCLTFERSYLARLNYVHQNAVRHGLVAVANQYGWCSAVWFEREAVPAMVKTVYGFKTDQINVPDDF
jgi:putative transposase